MASRPKTSVADIMSRRVVAIRSDCGLEVAADTLGRAALRHLVVVEPDRAVRGILSAEDLVLALGAPGGRTVGDVVVDARRFVRPDDDIRRAAELMLDALVDAVLVAEGSGRVVGIVTWSDVVAHVAGRAVGERGTI